MNAVVACWEAAGRPEPNWQGKAVKQRSVPPVRIGTCALLGVRAEVVDIRHVLSDLFTAWDRLRWRNDADAGLSIPAAWAFRERVAMQQPHGLVAGTWRPRMKPSELFDSLMRLGPLDVVTVPQSRQKHLLPYATIGTVRVDDESLRWGDRERDLLGTVRTLRRFGFGEAALAETAPRWPILQKLDRPDRRWVVEHWGDLDEWRKHAAYFDVACRATREDKEK